MAENKFRFGKTAADYMVDVQPFAAHLVCVGRIREGNYSYAVLHDEARDCYYARSLHSTQPCLIRVYPVEEKPTRKSVVTKTGWPPGLLQDDSKRLTNWFASRIDARWVLRRVCLEIELARNVREISYSAVEPNGIGETNEHQDDAEVLLLQGMQARQDHSRRALLPEI